MDSPSSGSRPEAHGLDAPLRHEGSVAVAAPAEVLYDLVTDIARTGEWSPVCVGCSWDEAGGPRVGAWFTGRNEAGGRAWQTRSQVEVADPGQEFAWVVGEGYVRWGYRFDSLDAQHTRLTESWHFLPAGVAMFRRKYGADADARIAERTRQAVEGIPATLAAIKEIAEGDAERYPR